MSRKQMLTKKVAHTLLAMSIVSASGLNLWAGTAWAADDGLDGDNKIVENVTIDESYIDNSDPVVGKDGENGQRGSSGNDNGGNGGKGGSAALSGALTVNDSSKDVNLTVQGGKGGNSGGLGVSTPETVSLGNSGDGGSAKLQIAVGSEVNTGTLGLTATAGSGGSKWQ